MTHDRAADLQAACKALCDGPRHRWRLDRVIQCAITLHLEAAREPVEPRQAEGGVIHLPGSPLRSTGTGTPLASISDRYPQDDFARRYPPARTVMLHSGPRPTNPAEDAGDMA